MKQSVYIITISLLTIFFIGCEEPESIKTPSTVTSKNLMEFRLNGKVKSVFSTSNEIEKGHQIINHSHLYYFDPSGSKTLEAYYIDNNLSFKHKWTYDSNNDLKQRLVWNRVNEKWEVDEVYYHSYDRYHRKIKTVMRRSSGRAIKTLIYRWSHEKRIISEKLKQYNSGFDHITNYTYDTKGNVRSELYYKKNKLISQCYFQYNDLTNRLIQTKLISASGVVVYTYIQNNKGQEIGRIMKVESFQNNKIVTVIFPEISYNYIVGVHNDFSKNVIRKLDQNANWVYKKEDLDSIQYVSKREITYY